MENVICNLTKLTHNVHVNKVSNVTMCKIRVHAHTHAHMHAHTHAHIYSHIVQTDTGEGQCCLAEILAMGTGCCDILMNAFAADSSVTFAVQSTYARSPII